MKGILGIILFVILTLLTVGCAGTFRVQLGESDTKEKLDALQEHVAELTRRQTQIIRALSSGKEESKE